MIGRDVVTLVNVIQLLIDQNVIGVATKHVNLEPLAYVRGSFAR